VLATAFAFGSMPLSAQVSRTTPAPYGYHSFTRSIQLDPGMATGLVTDAAGHAYVNIWWFPKIAPDGTVVSKYTTPYSAITGGIALGDNGSLWVGGLGKFDSQGVLTRVSFTMATDPIATDALGNVYGIANDAAGTTLVVKMDRLGNQIASFDTQIPASGNYFYDDRGGGPAITVDSTGAVYVAGSIPTTSTFPTTPGAYRSNTANSQWGTKSVYVFKVAPTLDHLVYAALIGGNGVNTATAIAVDGAGEAFVAGSGEVGIANPFPLTDIGFSASGVQLDAFVLKLSADGSSLIYSAGLGPGSAVSIAPLADGSVPALVKFDSYGAAVVTIDSAGDAITREQFIPPPSTGNDALDPVALAPGADGSIRVLMTTRSSGFIIGVIDEENTPLLVDIPATVPSADISIAMVQLWPWACTSSLPSSCDYLGVRALVTNNGPDDAEAVQVTLSGPNSLLIECIPNGVATCAGPVLIPHLAVGATTSIDFVFDAVPPLKTPLMIAALALTSDTNMANNLATLTPEVVIRDQTTFLAVGTTPFDGVVYRSDIPAFGTYPNTDVASADPALSVWGPSPQAVNGNLWYFESWPDGSTDNPRVFDATNGVPLWQAQMKFLPAQRIGADPASLDFVVVPGVVAPATRAINIYPVAQQGSWTLKVGTPGASWVTVNVTQPGHDSISAPLTGSVDTTGLAPGYYTTTVPVSLIVSGSLQATRNIPISLRIASLAPVINAGGIVNAASYQANPLTSGEIVTIFGSGLGPPQLVQATVPQAGRLPTSLAGTRVVFDTDSNPSDEVGAELLYVQDGSISAIVPYFFVGVTVTVELGGAAAVSTTVPIGESTLPGVFTLDQSGTGNVAAVNADGTINSPQNPAKRGSMVLLYVTGIAGNGPYPCWLTENFSSNRLAATAPAEVNIGGEFALVVYSGSAPGMTCAAQQINVIIPEDSQTGPAVPLRLGVSRGVSLAAAQSGLTLAIQ
jgi:uncharacterized protein (TIGR03437 family)